ncbi:MAG: manganese efflux pump [Ruminococcaceae bacterium]|nr:manganese efflux pump [Oscillospiraceae bacterium]
MPYDFMFFFQSILLGVGLAMDAFSVSLANGLNEPKMKKTRHIYIAGIFAFFQFIMPLAGFFCVHTVASFFSVFEKFIPWIALGLLGFIGGKMLIEGIKSKDNDTPLSAVSFGALILQGIATSIDALSVGFTISHYTPMGAFLCCLLIAVTTFIICMAGITLGKKFGTKLSGKASILGGCILIFIGLEIFITSFF